MINITFPDNSIKKFEKGITGLEIAKSISNSLAKSMFALKLNDEIINIQDPINYDGKIKIITWNDDEGKETFWHSSSHLMAEAIQSIYPKAKFTIGPAVKNGFYYDIDFNDKIISQDDLDKIEKKMRELSKNKSAFSKKNISKKEALKFFHNNEYKKELIEELQDGEITFYQQGDFVDLCKGPHIPNTGYIKAVKLLYIAGAYWRGDEKNKQLTRIYGISFPKQQLLEEYLVFLEEAKKRDHRIIGKKLEIFTFDDDVGPGLPLWLPNGTIMIEELEKLAKEVEKKANYLRVKTPHIAKQTMYEKSGHLPYYKESMFPAMELDGEMYFLKAMNCPHHHKIYASKPRSYKDLPIRLAEYGTCYRYEKSGELFGLMRVRSLQMNDAHIYCSESDFSKEFEDVNKMYLEYFKIFGIEKFVMRFSTHDPKKLGKKYVNSPELWKKTEDMVRKTLEKHKTPYIEISDEAAFYGPKIDVQVWSAIGKEFTLATNQVDFAQPINFDLKYKNSKNEYEKPIIIHRAPLGTHERFIGFLLEHFAGNLPLWISPNQVTILPVSDQYNDYARKILISMKNYDIRTLIDERREKIGRKIRDAETQRIPYMIIVGEREKQENKISIRKRNEGDMGSIDVDSFVKKIKNDIINRIN